jgi:hypothetical protein
MMHPKAAYLALNGCVPMKFRGGHHVIDFRCVRSEADAVPVLGRGNDTWKIWAGMLFTYEPSRWELVPDLIWDALSWDLIKEFCHGR